MLCIVFISTLLLPTAARLGQIGGLPVSRTELVSSSNLDVVSNVQYKTCGDDMVYRVSLASDHNASSFYGNHKNETRAKRRFLSKPSGLEDLLGSRTASTSSMSFRRELFWTSWANFDSYKTETSMWGDTPRDGRPTLNTMHYILLPIWWEAEPKNSGTWIEPAQLESVMSEAQRYYDDMSWNQNHITFEIWPQEELIGVTFNDARFGSSARAARARVEAAGYVQFEDYSGIMLVYNPANPQTTPFGRGGWANVNGTFWIH